MVHNVLSCDIQCDQVYLPSVWFVLKQEDDGNPVWQLPHWHCLSRCECVYSCLGFGHSPGGRSVQPLGSDHLLHPPQLHLSSHFISVFTSSSTQSCKLPDISTLTSHSLSKLLPCTFMHLCARAPFWGKAACVYIWT